ncbi:MAG: glycosyltransferase family 2 protein [Deltaproteobacteria bacterium]|nr:glycosyltransferase family 2 protein [Deltaproteobacteria bacterium]
MSERPHVSVVIPVFNEEESLPRLHAVLTEELEKLGRTWEILFCDDGSSDRSLELLRSYSAADSRIKVISFRRNFGQTAAMDAGFRHAAGEVVIPMDADLQNDPADIAMLLSELDGGYDVIKGWRKDRKDTFVNRTLPSRIANGLISRVTGVRLHDYGCTLTAYRREVLEPVRLYGEMHRFIPAYAVWAGGRIKEVVVRHHPRQFGKTKYNLTRTFRVLLDLLTVRFLLGYSTKPLYFFGKWGFALVLMAFMSLVWSVFKRVVWQGPFYSDPFFYATIVFSLAALQIVLFGLLAELNVRTYFESRGVPPYVVKEKHNLGTEEPPCAG